jgi:hypothetical protein
MGNIAAKEKFLVIKSATPMSNISYVNEFYDRVHTAIHNLPVKFNAHMNVHF